MNSLTDAVFFEFVEAFRANLALLGGSVEDLAVGYFVGVAAVLNEFLVWWEWKRVAWIALRASVGFKRLLAIFNGKTFVNEI